jgi:hypothetical protein
VLSLLEICLRGKRKLLTWLTMLLKNNLIKPCQHHVFILSFFFFFFFFFFFYFSFLFYFFFSLSSVLIPPQIFFLLFLNLHSFNFSNTYSTSLNPDSTIFGQPNKITTKHLGTKHYTEIKPKIQTLNFPSFNLEPNKNQTNLLAEKNMQSKIQTLTSFSREPNKSMSSGKLEMVNLTTTGNNGRLTPRLKEREREREREREFRSSVHNIPQKVKV